MFRRRVVLVLPVPRTMGGMAAVGGLAGSPATRLDIAPAATHAASATRVLSAPARDALAGVTASSVPRGTAMPWLRGDRATGGGPGCSGALAATRVLRAASRSSGDDGGNGGGSKSGDGGGNGGGDGSSVTADRPATTVSLEVVIKALVKEVLTRMSGLCVGDARLLLEKAVTHRFRSPSPEDTDAAVRPITFNALDANAFKKKKALPKDVATRKPRDLTDKQYAALIDHIAKRILAGVRKAKMELIPEEAGLKIPYGISDYAEIVTDKYFWRDTSSYVAELAENGGKHQLFLRPPRFGKSLNLSMLSYYLDVQHAGRFDELFQGTALHSRKAPLKHHNQYHVMNFDFTVDVGDGSATAVARAFQDEIARSVRRFGDRYGFDVRDENPKAMMKSAAWKIVDKGGKVFVLVDEYDRFANKVMFEHPDQYAKIVSGTSGDLHSSPLRSFFEAVKAVNVRSFTTGITPIALADASGANMIEDLTHSSAFGEMCGFLKTDIEFGVRGVLGSNHEAVQRVVDLMEHFYNGYRFNGPGVDYLTQPLFNTQLCLYFLKQLQNEPKFRDNVIDKWSKDFSTADTKELLDKNVGVSENVMRVLAKHPTLPFIQAQLVRGPLPAKVNESLRLRELQEYSSTDSLHRLSTFLFHHGLVTLATATDIRVPNRLVKDPAKGLLSHLQPMIKNRRLDVLDVVRNPTVEKVWGLLHTILDGLGTKFDKSFSEGAVQAVIEGVLRTLPNYLMNGVTVVCEEEHEDVNGERMTSFQWCPRRRMDMYLRSGSDVLLLEFKRLRPGNTTSTAAEAPAWERKRTTAAEDRAPLGGGCKLTEPMNKLTHLETVQELEDHAQAQCNLYKSILTNKGLKVVGFTVIHWTQNEGWPSALLVKEVK